MTAAEYSKGENMETSTMFSDSSKPISMKDIGLIELELGIHFPQSFINHYLTYNGGIPSKPFFYSEETGIETEIQLFLPLRYKFDNIDIKTIEEKYIFLKQKSLLMTDYLPFANDYGANQICMNLDNGRIYIVYMDVGEIEQKSFKYLASGFSEFVRGLSAESRGYIMKRLFKAIRQNDIETVKKVLHKYPEKVNCMATAPPKRTKDNRRSKWLLKLET